MSRGEAWSLHLSNVLVGGTGVVYAWMRYLAEPEDPFAVVNHPLQPLFQHLHILVAPLLVFGAGMIFKHHVWARVVSGFKPRRRMGLTLGLTLVPMVVSGYLLQTTGDPLWNNIWVWVHVTTSVLWVLGYGIHLLTPRPQESAPVRARPRPPEQPRTPAEPGAGRRLLPRE